MKTIITLAIVLFNYPWNSSGSKTEDPLFQGMYTITGRGYNEHQQFDSPAGCQAIYVKVYEQKLVTTVSVYGTGEYQDVKYEFEGTDKNGYRVYRRDNTDAFIVDSEQNIQRIISIYTYNGNRRSDTYYEVIKGDYSMDCLKRMQNALEYERMKSVYDLNSGY